MTSSNTLLGILNNKAIVIPLTAWFVTQSIKVIIATKKEKKFDLSLFFIPGGFPSSHSASVTALSVVVGYLEGVSSLFFAITVAFAAFVLYDASVLRRAAQRQAQSLNDLIEFINIKEMEPLREVLGHSFLEVLAGAIIGIATGFLMML